MADLLKSTVNYNPATGRYLVTDTHVTDTGVKSVSTRAATDKEVEDYQRLMAGEPVRQEIQELPLDFFERWLLGRDYPLHDFEYAESDYPLSGPE